MLLVLSRTLPINFEIALSRACSDRMMNIIPTRERLQRLTVGPFLVKLSSRWWPVIGTAFYYTGKKEKQENMPSNGSVDKWSGWTDG